MCLASPASGAGWPEGDRYRALPCRPTISCTADLVPPGTLEIEAGYLGRRVPPSGFIHAEPVLFKLTIVDWLQLQLGGNGKLLTSGEVGSEARYLDDIALGAKVHFLDQRRVTPSLAVSAALQIPSWDRPKSFPYAYDATFWFYASKDVQWLHVDLNGGVTVWQFDVEPSRQLFATLALGANIGSGFGLLMEGYAFENAGNIAPRDAGILQGLTWSPKPWVIFDIGIDKGLIPSTRTFSAFFGATVVVYDLWDDDTERTPKAAAYVPKRIR
jgi:hypothetical protein